MKTLVYTGNLGPERVSFGVAGSFVKGQPVLIDNDQIAAQLLAKGCFEEQAPPKPAKAATTPTEV